MSEARFPAATSTDPTPRRPALLGCPLDVTSTFRLGTGGGPAAIRWGAVSIESYSYLLDADLDDHPFSDLGDLDFKSLDMAGALELIETRVTEILSVGAIPFCLGGEHTITVASAHAVRNVYPDLTIIHLDAHTDLRDDYEGNHINHATVMRRTAELIDPSRLIQLGVRSGTREEFAYARSHARLMDWRPGAEHLLVNEVAHHPVYVTLDLDVLDPSCFPGVGNPEPGGWMYHDLERFFLTLRELKVVGLDVVELNPDIDVTGVSSITAAKVARELLLVCGQQAATRCESA